MNNPVIGIDLGATKIHSARILDNQIEQDHKLFISRQGTESQVVGELISSIKNVFNSDIAGIGIGVPSVVDVDKGIVYDVQNIPSWKEVHLKKILEEEFSVPVYVNNDANCFALGEKYFGKGKDHENLVGLIVGTGMAAGIIIQNKLYNGANCGAGEFGMIPYLDHNVEYYASGQFFENVYQTKGQELFERASGGEENARRIFDEFGQHLGHGIMRILYAIDPEIIILGGSVSKAYSLFEKSLWKCLEGFAYQTSLKNLEITVSENPNIAVLGAASLYYNALSKK